MATNWTSTTFYTDAEAFAALPPLLGNNFTLTTDSPSYYLHTEVKERLKEMILDTFNDFDGFDIEQIEVASITGLLKPVAILFNSALVARYQSKDPEDTYFALWDDYYRDVFSR